MAEKQKRGRYAPRMVQLSVNVPEAIVMDLDRLAKADGLSMNVFSRKYIQQGIEAEKAKRGWV